MTARLTIAVDCDNVLVDTADFFARAYNDLYGTCITLESVHDLSPEVWQADEPTRLSRLHQLTLTDEYRRLRVSAEAASVLAELAKDHRLVLITARKEEEREHTKRMIEDQLGGIFDSMAFVGWEGSKGDVCQDIGADVLIDDNAHHLHDALQQGLLPGGALLFGDYPWNRSDRSSDGIVYCPDWKSVGRSISRLGETNRVGS